MFGILTILEKNGLLNLEGKFTDTHISVINALRRYILSKVETYAFYDDKECLLNDDDTNNIVIKKNNTILNNEFIKHRILLLPILKDPDTFVDLEKKTFSIDKKTKTEDRNVTSHDIVVGDDEDVTQYFGPDPITLTRLNPPDGEFHCVMKCVKGNGKKHATFSPVSKCVHYYNDDQNHINFSVESIGQYSSIALVEKGMTLILEDLEHLKEHTTIEMLTENTSAFNDKTSIDFIFNDTSYDYSLFELIQQYVLSKFVDVTYIGCCKRHPLENIFILRTILVEKDKDVYLFEFQKWISSLIQDFLDFKNKIIWN